MIRIRHALSIALLGTVFLTGCLAPENGSGMTEDVILKEVSLAGGDVVIGGPRGYCIDPATLRKSASRSFALIASCHILSQGKAGTPVVPLIVSVTIGSQNMAQSELPSPEQLAGMAGAGLLAQDVTDGLVLALLDQGGDTVLEDGDSRSWRGVFVMNNRLVGLSLYAPRGSAFTGQPGADFLRSVWRRSQGLSSRQDAPQSGATLLAGLFRKPITR